MIKYQKIGDILLVKKIPTNEEINKLIKKTKCKTILKYDYINGNFREPNITKIYGNKTETIQKEYGVLYKIDVSKIMWSMGNIDERRRMATISNKNEVVIDMFAGIGYFTIPLAKFSKPKKIYAIEINPNSYYYLIENIKLNNIENYTKIIPILNDNKKVNLTNKGDRIIMGYILKTKYYLSKALDFLNENGGVIHYHDTIAEKILDNEPYNYIKEVAKKHNYTITNYKLNKIKKYSPGVWHIVADITFEKI